MPSSGVQTCALDRKSTRLNSSHTIISYAVFCLKKRPRAPRQLCDDPVRDDLPPLLPADAPQREPSLLAEKLLDEGCFSHTGPAADQNSLFPPRPPPFH